MNYLKILSNINFLAKKIKEGIQRNKQQIFIQIDL